MQQTTSEIRQLLQDFLAINPKPSAEQVMLLKDSLNLDNADQTIFLDLALSEYRRMHRLCSLTEPSVQEQLTSASATIYGLLEKQRATIM